MIEKEKAQDESKTGEQASSMNGNSDSVPAGRGSDPTSPSPSPSEGRHAEAAETTAGSNVLKMSSTDSAGNARGPSCGLVSSLLPTSCRGSAEAFARCLHRRLTSLSGENGSPERAADAAVPRETSWLHPSSSSNRHSTANSLTATNQHPILQHQPRHSSESDLFYELEDGSGSPAEEATAAELAHLLVNPEILKANHHDACHCSPSGTRMTSGLVGVHSGDSESGCIFASPIAGTPPDSDSSEVFFDPESSDAEKLKNEVFFDPVSTSDSEVNNSNLTNSNFIRARTKIALNGCVRRTNTNVERNEDTTSESSCSSRRNPASCINGQQEEQVVCSSEDSLNGRSSQETTSPSHESLWSTFDDSTMSLQDESPPRINQNSVVSHICLPKSHSDSELPSNGINTAISNKLKTDRWNEEVEEEEEDEDNEKNKNDEHDVEEVNFVNGVAKMGNDNELDDFLDDVEDSVDKAKNREGCTEFADITKASSINTAHATPLKVDDTIANDTDQSTYSSAVDVPEELTLECSSSDEITTPKSELKLRLENDDAQCNDEDKRLSLLLKKLGGNSNVKEDSSSPEQETQSEIVEEEEDRPQRVRRCSSLKTGKTPPGTPHRKKIVRFADKLGLDLADVRTFLDEIPKIPNSAYSDLIYDDIFRPQQDGSPDNIAATTSDHHWCDRFQDDGRRRSMSAIPRKLDRMLVPLFQQPGGAANFLDVVRERRVCLENVLVQDPVTLAIQGTVRVINLDFHKSVHIRYTLNSWRNFSDLQATYVPNSCDGFSDKFTFILYCHTLLVGQRLEFAVRFQCKGAQYWDNNGGANYCFQCLPATSSPGYIPITAENRCGNWSPTFY
ncbi:glycogen-binding subunit 76A isoform X2 [Cataglyphis hispanica]|uniref:glycogen-binding subunit 76A isoform X2 n=1 Tax=Cataglyphis hispanica TaxID=1086592 RepID=UPI00217F3A48|nr:glycogen-binding subunit 76A isoform X2 [Cataglyphis hispanica]